MSIVFHFDHRKVIQAAAVLAKAEPAQTLSRMRLLKLLYICDREALKEIGRTITGDTFCAMKKGPVLSQFYDMIKGESSKSAQFEKHFSSDRFYLKLKKSPGIGHLNRFEIRKLKEVSERFQSFDDEDLSELTHEFKEWMKYKPEGNSSTPIPIEDILEAIGIKDSIPAVAKKAELRSAVSALWE